MVLKARKDVRARAEQHLEECPYSAAGIRLSALVVQFNLILSGRPVSVDAIERALSGLGTVVPIRPAQHLQRQEVS